MTLRFYNRNISAKVKAKFGLESHSWQITVVTNITHYKKDVFVIASTNAGKNLTYQSIFKITEDIILVISPIITLIEDQT